MNGLTPAARWQAVQQLTKLACFRAQGALTFCNEFVQTSAFLWGCLDFAGKLARDIHLHMRANPGAWKPASLAEGQLAANQGLLVVCAWSDAAPGGDHVCLLAPGKLEASAKWGCDVPQCANVGKDNFFGKGLSWAFPSSQRPEVFVWVA